MWSFWAVIKNCCNGEEDFSLQLSAFSLQLSLKEHLPIPTSDLLAVLKCLMVGRTSSFSFVPVNQMIEYVTATQLLQPNHHEYRAHHNTTTALIQLYYVWVEAVKDRELAGVCFLDMSAAFDNVDHSLLLEKLELYGFDKNMLNWTNSYMVLLKDQYLALTLFTYELPETVHDHANLNQERLPGSSWQPFSMGCTNVVVLIYPGKRHTTF